MLISYMHPVQPCVFLPLWDPNSKYATTHFTQLLLSRCYSSDSAGSRHLALPLELGKGFVSDQKFLLFKMSGLGCRTCSAIHFPVKAEGRAVSKHLKSSRGGLGKELR